MQNSPYTLRHHPVPPDALMPAQNVERLTDFGKRLAALRKETGYTQQELADELGVSQRMISHYEGQSEYPPAALLPRLAELLKVSTDELLGIAPRKKSRQPDSRLLRRMQQIDKLSAAKRKQIMQVIDTFIEHEQLKQKA